MSEQSKIEWCDATVNFVIGCSKISDGCRYCYAEAMDRRNLPGMGGKVNHWGKGAQRLDKCDSARKLALRLNRKAKQEGRRLRVFANSLSDWLDPEWESEWFVSLMDTIRQCENLDWLLLTKRPEEWNAQVGTALAVAHGAGYAPLGKWLSAWVNDEPPQNVWIGASVEGHSVAKSRIEDLLGIPAAVRFLSCEPLLERVTFSGVYRELSDVDYRKFIGRRFLWGINWVIVGGESGVNARPFDPDWARSIRDECALVEVPFFMKQMGGKRKPFAEIPEDLMVREFPEVEGDRDA